MSSKHHHATDETLMCYAAGTLASGPAIVVEAHLAGCSACRTRVGNYEAVGGALLDEIEPTPLSMTAFNDMMARIDAEDASAPARQSRKPVEIEGVRLPDAPGRLRHRALALDRPRHAHEPCRRSA
jgi:putative transcriptional regulator